jgi:hypothetical protein
VPGGSPSPPAGPGGPPLRPRPIAMTINTTSATAPAPISAHAQSGRPLDSSGFEELWLAAAAPRAAAGALLFEVVVVGVVVVGVVTV